MRDAYHEVDRSGKPANFVQSEPEEYNDILNNFRVPLGEYQFKRALFAKKYLYTDFSKLLSFAFCREPADRAVSMFFAFGAKKVSRRQWARRIFAVGGVPRGKWATSYLFDAFLDAIDECRSSGSTQRPLGLHFQTHTAAMFDDVTDQSGTPLLRHIWRLENLIAGLNQVRGELGLKPICADESQFKNRTKRVEFALRSSHRKKLEQLFSGDFDLYERAGDYEI